MSVRSFIRPSLKFFCCMLLVDSSLSMVYLSFDRSSPSWGEEINDSNNGQDGSFFTLCDFYALVSAIALIQFIRIAIRIPEYGWTTQKVFHLMNFIVNGVRAIVFGFHVQVFNLHPKVCIWLLLEVPGMLFISTYTLLALFWAEIYHQARSLPTDKLRAIYVCVNIIVYVIQVSYTYKFISFMLYSAVVSFMAALGFLLYGGRLFFMLRRFPIESKGRRKKLHEVGSVTAICFTCFAVRCFIDVFSAFDSDVSLDVLDHPVLYLIFYMLMELNFSDRF
ncbi:hypothetical protein R6Q57_015864 [Mikania cordata]